MAGDLPPAIAATFVLPDDDSPGLSAEPVPPPTQSPRRCGSAFLIWAGKTMSRPNLCSTFQGSSATRYDCCVVPTQKVLRSRDSIGALQQLFQSGCITERIGSRRRAADNSRTEDLIYVVGCACHCKSITMYETNGHRCCHLCSIPFG